jgi:hypothetical protein
VVYYAAVHLAQSQEHVAEALVAADQEIDLDDVGEGATKAEPVGAPA